MRSSKEFTTLIMDIGEVKVRFRNYLKHQAQRKKRQKMDICLTASKYIPRPNASMSLFAKPNDIHQADFLYLLYD